MSGELGDKVGYRVIQLHARHWVETDCPTLDTINQALRMLRDYRQDDPAGTYAVARLHLVMISRPDHERGDDARL